MADLKQRIRTLEAIRPPQGSFPPVTSLDYGYDYFQYTPTIFVFGGGATPTISQASGLCIATHTRGTSGMRLVHCMLSIFAPVGGSAGDWWITFPTGYPRQRILSAFPQNYFGRGYVVENIIGTVPQKTRIRVWPTAANAFVHDRFLLQIGPSIASGGNVSKTTPFTFGSLSNIELVLDYWSPGP